MIEYNAQQISPEIKGILENYIIVDSTQAPFCVDGRAGERKDFLGNKISDPYPQALGGSLHFAALQWIAERGERPFEEVVDETLNKMNNLGYGVGVHTGAHRHGENSDCGFADNLPTIIQTLDKKNEEILSILTSVDPSLAHDKERWDDVINLVKNALKNISNIPSGYNLVFKIGIEKHHASLQTLEGEHKEVAAVVNLKPNTTLNVDENQDHQAFNLDLWYVLDVAEKLGMDDNMTKFLSLGLYVATEMVLVEEKRGYRLPIIVRQ